MLEIVELHLKKAGFRCCTIKGSVAAKQRSDLVDTFNSDPAGPEVRSPLFSYYFDHFLVCLWKATFIFLLLCS